MDQKIKVFIASDHTGFVLKANLIDFLRDALEHEVVDVGAHELVLGDDYPDFIAPCAQQVAEESKNAPNETFGIVIGGSGQGEAMVANRTHGVHAISAVDAEGAPSLDGFDIVRLARRHNNANVLSLAARFVSQDEAKEAIRIFLDTPFNGGERHVRRISKF
jgi:ribose 5-phosphate isomerase B